MAFKYRKSKDIPETPPPEEEEEIKVFEGPWNEDDSDDQEEEEEEEEEVEEEVEDPVARQLIIDEAM